MPLDFLLLARKQREFWNVRTRKVDQELNENTNPIILILKIGENTLLLDSERKRSRGKVSEKGMTYFTRKYS